MNVEFKLMKNYKKIFVFLFVLVSILNVLSVKAVEKNADFVVVIDAGHGGNDTGAVDNGVREKDINLAVAKRLQEDIQRRLKGVKVIMTRSTDNFVTLQGRADIANKNKADLFISIHTNSVDAKNPNRKSVSGASVYALGLHKDKDNLNIAKRENSVIELEKNYEEKYSGFDPSKDESYIIFEMAQKKNLEQSLRFADMAQKQLVAHAGRSDRGVKQAGFWVLWATSMPAILVELDFICNPASAKFMGSHEGERKMAEALCNAVEQYYNNMKHKGAVGKHAASAARNSASSVSNLTSVTTDKGNTPVASGTVSTVSKEKRTDTPPSVSGPQTGRKIGTARKRRSASSKVSSERRDLSTSSIKVKSEADYLAKREEKIQPPAQVKKESEIKETPKERKKRISLEKKKKEKERKELEAKKKREAQQARDKDKLAQNNANKNNKSQVKFVVNKNGEVSKAGETASASSTTSHDKKRKSLNSRKN